MWDWYADENGVVRAGISYEGSRWTIWYRDKPGEKLRVNRGKFPKDDDSTVDRFIFRGDHSWVVTNERTGRFGLYKYDMKSQTVGEAIFEHPEVDLDDVDYDALTGDVSAVEYQDDRSRVFWIDADMKALQKKLDDAIPTAINLPVGWSHDEKRVLVSSSSAADPGRYFLLDRNTMQMHPVVELYPSIDPEQLAAVKPIRYSARDGLALRGYLTVPRDRPAKGLPLIIMPHGGPFARDDWEYDAFVQLLANRGYAVLQPEFRGSTGSARISFRRATARSARRCRTTSTMASTGWPSPARSTPSASASSAFPMAVRGDVGRDPQSRTLPLRGQLGRAIRLAGE